MNAHPLLNPLPQAGEGANVKSHFGSLPGAWYDLTCRIDSAREVASCALESLPSGLTEEATQRLNRVGNLIATIEDILKLMGQDVNVIEKTLHA